MRPRTKLHPVARLGQLCLLGAVLSPFGCADHKATGVTLALTSELSVGAAPGTVREIESIQIIWERAGNSNVVNGSQLSVANGDILNFPATLTFADDPDDKIEPTDDRLKLSIEATLVPVNGQPHKITRQLQVTFQDQQQKQVIVPLRFSCVDTPCQQDLTTCVDGECVPLQTQEASTLSAFDESAFNLKFTPPACFNAASTACFAGAVQVKPSGIRLDPDNTASCEFDIPNKGSADLDHLNVGVVWAEANGRYTVLDFNRNNSTTGWGGVPQKSLNGQDLIKVTLPKAVCDQVKFDASGRVKGVVYAFNNSCSHKEPAIETCADATADTQADKIACTSQSSIDPQAIKSRPCLDCAINDTGDAGTACGSDAGCQAIAVCTLNCQKLQKPAEKLACQKACLEIDVCDPESKTKAAALLTEAQVACATKCALK